MNIFFLLQIHYTIYFLILKGIVLFIVYKQLQLCNIIIYLKLFCFLDYEAIVKLSDNFNGADLRNVCTEAGLFAIRAEKDYVTHEDFMKAVRKVSDNKNLESKLDYKPI